MNLTRLEKEIFEWEQAADKWNADHDLPAPIPPPRRRTWSVVIRCFFHNLFRRKTIAGVL